MAAFYLERPKKALISLENRDFLELTLKIEGFWVGQEKLIR